MGRHAGCRCLSRALRAPVPPGRCVCRGGGGRVGAWLRPRTHPWNGPASPSPRQLQGRCPRCGSSGSALGLANRTLLGNVKPELGEPRGREPHPRARHKCCFLLVCQRIAHKMQNGARPVSAPTHSCRRRREEGAAPGRAASGSCSTPPGWPAGPGRLGRTTVICEGALHTVNRIKHPARSGRSWERLVLTLASASGEGRRSIQGQIQIIPEYLFKWVQTEKGTPELGWRSNTPAHPVHPEHHSPETPVPRAGQTPLPPSAPSACQTPLPRQLRPPAALLWRAASGNGV